MTWAARANNEGGIVRPRDFAVLLFRTSSNLVGPSTGMSAVLAPLRILSREPAVRRYRSRTIGPQRHQASDFDELSQSVDGGEPAMAANSTLLARSVNVRWTGAPS
jgi:hypothetical protein